MDFNDDAVLDGFSLSLSLTRFKEFYSFDCFMLHMMTLAGSIAIYILAVRWPIHSVFRTYYGFVWNFLLEKSAHPKLEI